MASKMILNLAEASRRIDGDRNTPCQQDSHVGKEIIPSRRQHYRDRLSVLDPTVLKPRGDGLGTFVEPAVGYNFILFVKANSRAVGMDFQVPVEDVQQSLCL